VLIDWAVAERAMPGQKRSGDMHLVKVEEKKALIAVIDGLGHGDDAAEVAKATVAVLKECSISDPLEYMIGLCHKVLLQSRGVVMSLARIDAQNDTMLWLGVGNVDGLLFHSDGSHTLTRSSMVLRGGVVGYQLPSLTQSVVDISRGDILVMFTDGIRHGFAENVILYDTPQNIADRILAGYSRDNDDALALVLRYTGAPE